MLIAALATPLVLRLATWFDALDTPGTRKVHRKAVPRLGGLAVFAAFLGTLVAVWFLGNQISRILDNDLFRLIVILAGGGIVLALGALDDLRGLRAKHKLAVEVLVALMLCAVGVRINTLHLPGMFEIHFGLWSWPITVMWIVGIANAMNLIDGLDGLATGIAAITCAPIALFALASGQILAACVMLSLLGALLGFLIYNFNPAKIFLGDSGSLFVGFMLASISVYCSVKAPMVVGLAAPALALGLPLFDTLESVIRRVLERRSLFSADAGHLHHRLLRRGLTHRRAVLLMYGTTLLAATAGMTMIVYRQGPTVMVFAGGVAVLMLLYRISGGMQVRQSLTLIKQHLDQRRERHRTKRISDDLQVQVDHINSTSELWTVLEDMAEKFNLNTLEMQLPHSPKATAPYKWQVPEQNPEPLSQDGHHLAVRIPFRLGTAGPAGELYAEVPIRGNAELAAGKVRHLSRIMDCACEKDLWATQEHELTEHGEDDRIRTAQMSLVD